MRYLGTCDGNMQERITAVGADVNVSVRKKVIQILEHVVKSKM